MVLCAAARGDTSAASRGSPASSHTYLTTTFLCMVGRLGHIAFCAAVCATSAALRITYFSRFCACRSWFAPFLCARAGCGTLARNDRTLVFNRITAPQLFFAMAPGLVYANARSNLVGRASSQNDAVGWRRQFIGYRLQRFTCVLVLRSVEHSFGH